MGWNNVMDNTIRLLLGCFWLLRNLSTPHLQLHICHVRSAGSPPASKDFCCLLKNSKDFMFPQISVTDPSPNPHRLAFRSFTSSVMPKTFKCPLSIRFPD